MVATEQKEPKTPLDIRRELIIYNQHITINNNYFYNKKLASEKIMLINDYFSKEGKPLSYNQFIQINGNIISHFSYIAIIDAIPLKWRKVLKTSKLNTDCCSIEEMPTCKLNEKIDRNVYMMSSKELYWISISQNLIQPSCINAWNSRLDIEIESKSWDHFFTLPFRCVQDIDVKALQLKIIHRIYASKSLVSKWDKDTKELCCICSADKANILHTFQDCYHVRLFWLGIEDLIRPILFTYVARLDIVNILFGIIPYTFGNHSLNHCLTYCRYFIHLETIHGKRPSVTNFKQYYNKILKLEKEMYLVKNEQIVFSKLFDRILAIL